MAKFATSLLKQIGSHLAFAGWPSNTRVGAGATFEFEGDELRVFLHAPHGRDKLPAQVRDSTGAASQPTPHLAGKQQSDGKGFGGATGKQDVEVSPQPNPHLRVWLEAESETWTGPGGTQRAEVIYAIRSSGAVDLRIAMGSGKLAARRAFRRCAAALAAPYWGSSVGTEHCGSLAGAAFVAPVPKELLRYLSASPMLGMNAGVSSWSSRLGWAVLGAAAVVAFSFFYSGQFSTGRSAAPPLVGLNSMAPIDLSAVSSFDDLTPTQQQALLSEAERALAQSLEGFKPAHRRAGPAPSGLPGQAASDGKSDGRGVINGVPEITPGMLAGLRPEEREAVADMLTSARITQISEAFTAKIAAAATITSRAGKSSDPKVYVVEDPLCPSCRQLDRMIKGLSGDLAVQSMAVTFQPGSKAVATSALCGKTGQAASDSWSRAMRGQSPSASATPADCAATESAINENNRIFVDAGFRATPMIVAPNGAVIRGVPDSPQVLLEWAKRNQKGAKLTTLDKLGKG